MANIVKIDIEILKDMLKVIESNAEDIKALNVRLNCLVESIGGVDEKDEECVDTYREEHH